jgi:hypothetical protein
VCLQHSSCYCFVVGCQSSLTTTSMSSSIQTMHVCSFQLRKGCGVSFRRVHHMLQAGRKPWSVRSLLQPSILILVTLFGCKPRIITFYLITTALAATRVTSCKVPVCANNVNMLLSSRLPVAGHLQASRQQHAATLTAGVAPPQAARSRHIQQHAPQQRQRIVAHGLLGTLFGG